MGVKATISAIILDATAAGRSMLTAANAAAQKTLLSLVKGDVGLGNVDNTSDANKPVSTLQSAADSLRVLRSGDTMTGPLTTTAMYIVGAAANGSIGLIADPSNAVVEAMQILPPGTSRRLYFGRAGQNFYALNFGNVAQFESCPNLNCTDGSGYGSISISCGVGRSGQDLYVSASGPTTGDVIIRASGSGYNSHQERMRIKGTTGNLLVGTATDDGTTRLQVSGAAKVSGLFTANGGEKGTVLLFAALPAASLYTDIRYTISDRTNRPIVKSDGTNWINQTTGLVQT